MQTEFQTTTSKKRGAKNTTKSTPAKISTSIAASDYMTTVEAAAYLKLSRQFLEAARYRGDGSGPPYIKLQRAVRYRRSVLDAWMSAHDHSPDKPIQAK
jgi:hypothetical protein